MFVVVSLFALWTGSKLNWIRQRHELLEKHYALAMATEFTLQDGEGTIYCTFSRAPGLLWIFGEQSIGGVELTFIGDRGNRKLSRDQQREIELAHELFPEAHVEYRVAELRKSK
jgi:hypothetical protein